MAATQLAFDLVTASTTTEAKNREKHPPGAARGAEVSTVPAMRTQAQETALTCPLCGGRLIGNVCEKCGMEVLR